MMRRAMARQAVAERDRRAKVIHAEGEFNAARRLAEAARVMATAPGAMQLRLLSTLSDVTAEKNSTLVFPVPIELLRFVDQFAARDDTPLPEPPEPPDLEDLGIATEDLTGLGDDLAGMGRDAADEERPDDVHPGGAVDEVDDDRPGPDDAT